MNQEKFGEFIKELIKRNNLTQRELAEKYNVTYQAVSKWENGKNMPDISLIKQISKDFNINIEDVLDGSIKPKKNKKTKIVIGLISLVIILLIIAIEVVIHYNSKNFEFKTLSSSCSQFTISGSIAYNDQKSSIYISNVEYCGGDDNEVYSDIKCSLYEKDENTEIKIDEYNVDINEPIRLEEFLKDLKFNIDNYAGTCKKYQDHSLYLLINATDSNNKIITYKIPLSLKENCK